MAHLSGRKMIRAQLETLCNVHRCEPEQLFEIYSFYGKWERELKRMIYGNYQGS